MTSLLYQQLPVVQYLFLLNSKPEFNTIMKRIEFTVTLLLLQLLVAP